MDNRWVDPSINHRERRERAYRRAAAVHRCAEATELSAARFFEALGDMQASARHRANAAAQHERADADDRRATAAAAGRVV